MRCVWLCVVAQVLVEPECMGTMVNGGEPGAIFHANPGHGTAKESKSPPSGRASGTVRRSIDGQDSQRVDLSVY
jgi:hypothetical protein